MAWQALRIPEACDSVDFMGLATGTDAQNHEQQPHSFFESPPLPYTATDEAVHGGRAFLQLVAAQQGIHDTRRAAADTRHARGAGMRGGWVSECSVIEEELSRSPTMKELPEEGMMDVSDGVNGLASTLEQVSLQQKRPCDLWRTELRAAPRKGRTTA